MSVHYAEEKIREALRLCGGNMMQARQQVTKWAQDDHALMNALTKPHLDGIIAYQIERVSSGRADTENLNLAPAASGKKRPDSFGMELLRAVADSEVTVFGLETASAPKGRKTASRSHIEAIHKMALARHNKNK